MEPERQRQRQSFRAKKCHTHSTRTRKSTHARTRVVCSCASMTLTLCWTRSLHALTYVSVCARQFLQSLCCPSSKVSHVHGSRARSHHGVPKNNWCYCSNARVSACTGVWLQWEQGSQVQIGLTDFLANWPTKDSITEPSLSGVVALAIACSLEVLDTVTFFAETGSSNLAEVFMFLCVQWQPLDAPRLLQLLYGTTFLICSLEADAESGSVPFTSEQEPGLCCWSS